MNSLFFFFFKDLNAYLISFKKREGEQEGGRKGADGDAQREVKSLQYVPDPPAVHPQCQFSAVFPNENVLSCHVRFHEREVTGLRTTECQK